MSVHVLIVEDDPVTQRVLRQRFTHIGFVVSAVVDNAADAKARFHELHPDLVTLDIEMPELLGVDAMALFHFIRAEDPNCEVVVITGTAFPTYREKFMKAGVLGFFHKPLDFDKLTIALHSYFPELKSHHPHRHL